MKSGPQEANCTSIDHVEFKGKEIQAPYACDPTDNSEMCKFYFNITSADMYSTRQNYYEVPCSCAMDGNSGFCSQIVGTVEYAAQVSKLKALYE